MCIHKLMRLWICSVLITSAGIAAIGQNNSGVITGSVQDSTGKVFVGAKVVIEPSDRRGATDDQGQFRIPNVPPGKYTLTTTYVGFGPYSTTVNVAAGQTVTVSAFLKVGSAADSVLVTAGRLQGDAEAVNVERMSDQIVQVEPAGVITSLPNTNIADAIGRLPSVSLERDEGEGKYVQIRGTEPRLSNLTINGVNVPSVEVKNRNVKMDAIPSNGIERIEVYKTLSADMDADGVGGTVNLVTPTAQDKPTYSLNGTAGYNPLQNGFWRGGFDGTFGHRWGANKKYGFLLGGTWDRTNRGIDDLEPSAYYDHPANDPTKWVADFNGEDLRSYDYYRTRYGFDSGIDVKITPTMSAYVKGLYADFHDFGETHVYTPNTGVLLSKSGNSLTYDNSGVWQYRHYIRRPDQQVFSFQTGARHDLAKNEINYEFAVSRGHNIGGQDFPTTRFTGINALSTVAFSEDLGDPYRPKIFATDGSNGWDAASYTVSKSSTGSYHATQVNLQGSASLSHSYTAAGHPSTFAMGVKVRNSYSTQRENDTTIAAAQGANGPFLLSDVLGTYNNPSYYDKSFAIGGKAYGPTSSYDRILKAVAASGGALSEKYITGGKLTGVENDSNTWYNSFYNVDERITAGYLQDVIFIGPVRLQGGVRFDAGNTHFLAYSADATVTAPCFKAPSDPTQICNAEIPNRQDADYFNVLPSAALQWQFQKDSNLRAVYSRGLARPNLVDLVPATTKDINQTPYPTVQGGNPKLVPTKSDNYDILVEHYFQPLGILQAGYFYKSLTDPIYPTTSLQWYDGNAFCAKGSSTDCKLWQAQVSINGPSAHIQGIEAQWEQRFSFLPGLLSGFGVNANYSHTVSQATFPTPDPAVQGSGFNGGRTDKPSLDRTSPNDYNFNLTYDKGRFSGRFAISHNDESIAAYNWSTTNINDGSTISTPNDPILGLKGPGGDNFFYPHTQFDVQGNYRVYKGWQVVASGLNLSNEVFGFYNGSEIYPVQREYYRPTLSFGFRWSAQGER
jgi:TonB-dependent receptor